MTRRAAVLGSPVAHSLSPVLHTAAYAALGLAEEWTYERHECVEDGLAAFLAARDDTWVGLSLTMPLKQVALELADGVAELAVQVGAANTLVRRDGGWYADNTDVPGIVAALRESGRPVVERATIIGAGATAASALAAVRRLGATAPGAVTVLARDTGRAGPVRRAAERLGAEVRVAPLDTLPGHLETDLVVSTVPAGAAEAFAETVAKSPALVFDVGYVPWPTPLAAAVTAAGGRAVGGFPMLLHQAAAQVELMTGRVPAPVAAMRMAGVTALRERAMAEDTGE